MSVEKIEEIYEEVKRKANNNKERQAYIRPSSFGFESTSDGSRTCVEFLKKDPRFKSVEIIGKDSLSITLF